MYRIIVIKFYEQKTKPFKPPKADSHPPQERLSSRNRIQSLSDNSPLEAYHLPAGNQTFFESFPKLQRTLELPQTSDQFRVSKKPFQKRLQEETGPETPIARESSEVDRSSLQ